MAEEELGSARVTLSTTAEPLQSSSYHPYGTERTSTGSGARTSYIGREYDKESDLGFGACPEALRGSVRLYEPEYGRFLSTDVLWGKYLPLQPFQYAGNNPVTGFDFTGLGPGDAFSSERAAAVDWVRTYGSQVSDSKVEYASAIGKGLDAAGNIFYTYNEPREGTRTGSTPELLSVSEATRSKDLVEVAYIHSHPKEVDDPDLKTTPNSLSGRDVESAESNNVNVYAYVPNGKLLVYDHTRNREGQVDLTDSPGAKREVRHGGVPDMEVPRRVMVDEQ